LHQAAENGVDIVSLPEENYLFQKFSLVRVLPNLQGPPIKAYYNYPKEKEGDKTIVAFKYHLKEAIKQKGWQYPPILNEVFIVKLY